MNREEYRTGLWKKEAKSGIKYCSGKLKIGDKEYLAYQLNLYRIGYQQSYGKEIKFLRGIHLREEKRKFVEIPINEEKALELVKEWKENELLH